MWSALALGALTLGLLVGLPGTRATAPADGQTGSGEPRPYTDASVPAHDVVMIGSSTAEATDETWGMGLEHGASSLVRYTPETGWLLGPGLLDSGGQPLAGFQLDQPEAAIYPFPSPLSGQMTANGSGVLAGTVEQGADPVLLVRNPGGSFQETAPLPTTGEAALQKGERLLGVERAPMIAALDEADGHAGALAVPVTEAGGVEDRVLHWDGEHWTSEPIEIPNASKEEFQVLGIASSAEGASSTEGAWLLAKLSASHYPVGSVALFRRELGKGGETPTWQPVAVNGGAPGEPLVVPTVGKEKEEPFTVPGRYQSQVLTVTSEGVWLDGERADEQARQASTTMFFKPTGEEPEGEIATSWCKLPEGTEGVPGCPHELPEALSKARVRSFAWANASTPDGERVITGFPDGVSLRLDGDEFKRVLALGGGPSARSEDVGGTFGSAFSNPSEGWLGQERLPVHLTLEHIESRLKPWPVSFRHALLALAPAPVGAAGSLSSEALAVGDEGEVARYEPGKGWMPESLLGPGGKHETPLLRAVAWPTPTRAYAVGDRGQMWLWRGETDLWEADPATPLNFQGNLLGIAFDPNEPARGYAVGESGVLLRYGKTWTQEPAEALPSQVVGASFTSIAFAGSEAIVAYRKLTPSTEDYEGGLIVNDGSGWHIDEGAAAAIGAGAPWAVAALPDGGAAFTTDHGQVFERQAAGDPWQETPTPYPGEGSPGSIAVFRENGALRVIAIGSVPLSEIAKVESESSAPPGFPPTLIKPYPLESNQEKGVLRQTATGWSDEEHELNDVKEPEGEWAEYDTVYQPDPVAEVLVDPTGSQGWAVGGIADSERGGQLDTADVWRYPGEQGTPPVGAGSAPIATAAVATFAIGGGSQCTAPCADRAEAKLGPDMWLSHAMEVAGGISPRPRAFLYTGPRVTSGRVAGPATVPVPHQRELERYAELIAQGSIPAFAAASPTDLDLAHSEDTFEETFKQAFDYPFANALCETEGCQSAYYAEETGGSGVPVRVIVLDDSEHGEIGSGQLEWLEEELKGATVRSEPAIVIGNADLAAQIAAGGAGGEAAQRVVNALVNGYASAYFFDSPEQNVRRTLHSGSSSIEAFGSGTLGYVKSTSQEESDFIGASGFLLVEVGALNAKRVAEVKVKLIPDIGELALEAEEGTLLRRSQAALFSALARRPRSGDNAAKGSTTALTDPYIPIPANCVGTACAEGLFPEYEFSSSNPKVGNFVKPNLALEPNGHEPEYAANGKPIQEPESGSKSSLFCAFNPGTTTVTIKAGGLAASLPVTVEAGSARQPCGTVPAEKLPGVQQAASAPAPPPAPAPTPAPAAAPPPVPVPPPPPAAVVPRPAARPVPPTAFFVQPGLTDFVPGFVPPPVPQPARPTPPSGTSAVEAVEREEEEESAPESVSNQAVAYRAPEHDPAPAYILGIVVLAAFAGASVRRRPGRRGREIRVAPATISAMRAQRRMASRRGRLR
jgi:photosystem II stability/assembly factor-like uncharacterized protein